MDPAPSREDRRWSLAASLAVIGFIFFSVFVGVVALPLAQAPNANLDAWTAICRALGLQPGTPAQTQPPNSGQAVPVSQVKWTPRTLDILARADPTPGATIAAETCSSCHGEDGLTVSAPFPKLAGQSAEAIFKQLSDYRSGARFHPQMTAVAQSLTEDQLAQVAVYFRHRQVGAYLGRTVDTVDFRTARFIQRGDPARGIPPCEGCHARGVGGPPETPVIAGQNALYIKRQLLAYRIGERRNDVYRRMRDIAERLTPQEIDAVSQAYEATR